MTDTTDSLRIERSSESLRTRTTDVLRKAISEGQLAAGSRLVERELCDMTGVSRTIIRESLSHLEAEGLVRILPNKGPIVATLTIDQVRQIYEVREALEPFVAKLFVLHADDQALQQVRKAYDQMKAAFDEKDVHQITIRARALFALIRENSGNEFICQFLGRLSTRVDGLRETSMSQKGRLPKSLQEMKAIVTALERRDSAAAVASSTAHVRAAAAAAIEVLSEAKPAQQAAPTRRKNNG